MKMVLIHWNLILDKIDTELREVAFLYSEIESGQ